MVDQPKAYFRRTGFALLKGFNWTYLLSNTHIIIGRKPLASSSQWLVDLDLGPSKFVSRQHALLVYNFSASRFEIKCLTQKGRIKVNGKIYKFQDGAVALKHKSVISIHKTSFLFILPN